MKAIGRHSRLSSYRCMYRRLGSTEGGYVASVDYREAYSHNSKDNRTIQTFKEGKVLAAVCQ